MDFFSKYPYANCIEQTCKNLAHFVYHNLDNYYDRFIVLRSEQRNSRQWYKAQMGDKVGEIEYDRKYISNPNMKNSGRGRSSKSALELFKAIDDILIANNINVKSNYYDNERDKGEFRIRDVSGNWFCYDYTIKSMKIILEYHGEHVHPNKNWSTEKWNSWKNFYSRLDADEVYKKDAYKQKVAEVAGYQYHVIWHSSGDRQKLDIIGKIFNVNCDNIKLSGK